jgi:hypothetical protein
MKAFALAGGYAVAGWAILRKDHEMLGWAYVSLGLTYATVAAVELMALLGGPKVEGDLGRENAGSKLWNPSSVSSTHSRQRRPTPTSHTSEMRQLNPLS